MLNVIELPHAKSAFAASSAAGAGRSKGNTVWQFLPRLVQRCQWLDTLEYMGRVSGREVRRLGPDGTRGGQSRPSDRFNRPSPSGPMAVIRDGVDAPRPASLRCGEERRTTGQCGGISRQGSAGTSAHPECINALRGQLTEYGWIVAQGTSHVARLIEVVKDPASDLPQAAREVFAILAREAVKSLDERIRNSMLKLGVAPKWIRSCAGL